LQAAGAVADSWGGELDGTRWIGRSCRDPVLPFFCCVSLQLRLNKGGKIFNQNNFMCLAKTVDCGAGKGYSCLVHVTFIVLSSTVVVKHMKIIVKHMEIVVKHWRSFLGENFCPLLEHVLHEEVEWR
jgi:hypothetical protein